MNVTDDVWLSEHKHIVTTFKVDGMLGKARPTEILLSKMVLLNHRTHRTIEKQEPTPAPSQRDESFFRRFNGLNNSFHFNVGLILQFIMVNGNDTSPFLWEGLGVGFVFLNDAQGLFHLPLVVEVHLNMNPLATNVVEQRL